MDGNVMIEFITEGGKWLQSMSNSITRG